MSNGNIQSVLGLSFVDAQFALQGQGLIVQTPNLQLVVSVPLLMADGTNVTADDPIDSADSNAPALTAPYVVWQQPYPGTPYSVGLTPMQANIAIGYTIPTPSGPIPVP